MSGLREKQRADRHRRILEAAASLFRKVGYEGAKIEAIASEAEVSVGTIYNYYRNKGDILVAIVSMEVNEVLKAGRGVVATPPMATQNRFQDTPAAMIGPTSICPADPPAIPNIWVAPTRVAARDAGK